MRKFFLYFFMLCFFFTQAQIDPYVSFECDQCELNNTFQTIGIARIDEDGGNICCNKNYVPVLLEEFDGPLDTNIWATYYQYNDLFRSGGYAGHAARVHENGGAYYKNENVIVGGGVCTLHTKVETVNFPQVCFGSGNCVSSRKFTSGMLMSKQWFENFHRYEIRCKVPSGKGMWPAFWVFGWSTEIDVFEFINQKKAEFSLHHWGPNNTKIASNVKVTDLGDLSNEFHTYAVEHDKFFIKWYVDNVEVFKVSLFEDSFVDECNVKSENEGGYIKKNLAFPICNEPALQVIASSGAAPDASTSNSIFPNDYLIDYIRVYKIVSEDDVQNSCKNIKIEGPTASCNRIDTMEYCLKGVDMNANSWKLPAGMTMHQNPSLTITKRKITVNGIETIVFDTIVNKNCIKVIKNGTFFTGGEIEYDVPEECKFAIGDKLKKRVFIGLPRAEVTYTISGCDVKVCINGDVVDAFDIITWSEKAEKVSKNCWLFKNLKFGTKPPNIGKYNIFLWVSNNCGKSFIGPITIVNNNCVQAPANDENHDLETLIKLVPNPASDQFVVKKDIRLESELELLLVLNVHNNQIVREQYFNGSPELMIDSSNFPTGEYLIIVRDKSNKYHNSTLIINQN